MHRHLHHYRPTEFRKHIHSLLCEQTLQSCFTCRAPIELRARSGFVCTHVVWWEQCTLILCQIDVSAPTFLRSFKQFAARWGLPSHVISDNRKAFKVAATTIQAVWATRMSWDTSLDLAWSGCSAYPRPHGGAWERSWDKPSYPMMNFLLPSQKLKWCSTLNHLCMSLQMTLKSH